MSPLMTTAEGAPSSLSVGTMRTHNSVRIVCTLHKHSRALIGAPPYRRLLLNMPPREHHSLQTPFGPVCWT